MAETDIGIRVVVLGAAQASRILGNVRDDLSRFSREIYNSQNQMERFGKSVVSVGDALSSMGRTMTYTITAPLMGAVGALTNEGIKFEDAYANVLKTVDGLSLGFKDVAKEMYGTTTGLTQLQKDAVFANEKFGDLTSDGEDLRNEFRQLALEIPVSAAELARLGGEAGQLGIAKDDVIGFTETVALLGTTTDISAEEAVLAIARIGNILGVESGKMDEFAKQAGNAIVALGNTSAATESEIVNLTYRIAGAGRAVGLTTPEILALSSSLASAGVKAEMGGSAVSRILTTLSYAANDFKGSTALLNEQTSAISGDVERLRNAIQGGVGIEQLKTDFQGTSLVLTGLDGDLRAVEKGTMSLETAINNVRLRSVRKLSEDAGEAQKQMRAFANATGMSEDALVALIKTDPIKAFEAVLEGLTRMQEQGTLTSDVLDDMELNTIRLRDVMTRLGPNMQLVNDSITTSNEAWTEQIALQEEATKRFKTISAMIQLTKNTLADLGITIFGLVRDDIARFLKGIQSVATYLRDLDDGVLKTALRITVLVSAIGPLLLIVGTLTQLMGNSIIGFSKFGGAITGLLKLPFSGLNILSLLFGKTDAKGKSTSFINRGVNLITGIFSGITTKMIKPVAGLFSDGISEIFKLSFGGAKFAVGGIGTLVGSITKAIKTTIDLSLPILFPTKFLKLPFTILEKLTFGATKTVGKFLDLSLFGFSKLGGLLTSVVGKLPGFGSGLLKFVLSPLGKLPQILALAGTGFALLFGPKIISQFVKNKEKVLDEIKSSTQQFKEDLANSGIEKALLLFFSGGSTGSGREGGLRGIALALGASVKNANRFSYAMGTAAYWVIKIVKDTGKLLKTITKTATKTDDISNKTKTTGERLVSFAQSLAKFFEGLSQGWLKSFGSIINSTKVFIQQLGRASTAVGGLFDALFGRVDGASTTVKDFYASLEPGAETTSLRIGRTIGSIIGDIVTLTIQGLTFVTSIVTAVTNGLTEIVTAYKRGGIKEVFRELGPIIAGVFEGFLAAADVVWDNVKPKLDSFLDKFSAWILSDGIPALALGAKSLFDTLQTVLGDALFGKDAQKYAEKSQQRMFSIRPILSDKSGLGKSIGVMTPEEFYGHSADFQKNFFPEEFFRTTTTTGTIPGTEGLISQFGTFIGRVYDYLTSDEVKTTFVNAITVIGGWIGEQISNLIEILKPHLNNALDSVLNWIKTEGWDRLEEVGRNAIGAVASGIEKEMRDQAKNKGFQLIDKYLIEPLLNFAPEPDIAGRLIPTSQLADDFNSVGTDSGKALNDGLESGITDNLTTTQTAVDTLATKIKTTFKTSLSIFSPSHVFSEYGNNIIQGLVLGLSNTSPLYTAVTNISSIITNLQNNFTMSINSMLQQVTTAQAKLTALQVSSTTAALAAKSVFGSTVTNTTTSNTNSKVYSPVFNATPTRDTVKTNNNLYNKWMAVG